MASKKGRIRNEGTGLAIVTSNLGNKLLFFCKIVYHCVFSSYCHDSLLVIVFSV